MAAPCIRPRSADDPGYGQSILAENQLVVHGYTSFGVGLDLALPDGWPHSCREPRKLPFCPDYRTHKSSSSHNSSDTPKHPKYHRSFSAKHGGGGGGGTPMSAARKRSAMLDALRGRHSATAGSTSRLSSEATPSRNNVGNVEDALAVRASSLVEVNSDEASSAASAASSSPGGGGKKMMERTESLVSDVLSFYSMDGDDRASSKVSFGLTSPQSFRSQSPSSGQYETAEDGGGGGGGAASSGGYASSPVSTSSRYMSAASSLYPASSSASRYESAASGPPTSLSSPTSQQYETASQGSSSSHGGAGGGGSSRTYSSMSFDSHTLQPDR